MDDRRPLALIVAHGQPSDPGPAAAEMAAFAARVAGHLPGWRVTSATLAEERALEQAVADAGAGGGLVYPMFMADGWFTKVNLPRRLAAAQGMQDAAPWQILPPLGSDPALRALTRQIAIHAAMAAGVSDPAMILAAHGSFRSPAPAQAAAEVVALIREGGCFARVEAAFIDQEPRLQDLARDWPDHAFCLPFFAARGGHVIDDLPQALEQAGFRGALLPPVGCDARVPGLVAASLRRAAEAAISD